MTCAQHLFTVMGRLMALRTLRLFSATDPVRPLQKPSCTIRGRFQDTHGTLESRSRAPFGMEKWEPGWKTQITQQQATALHRPSARRPARNLDPQVVGPGAPSGTTRGRGCKVPSDPVPAGAERPSWPPG